MAFIAFDETKITDDSAATLSIEVLNYYKDRLQKRMEVYAKQADDIHYLVNIDTVVYLLQAVFG